MNIISFDIEEWYIEKRYYGGRNNQYQLYNTYLKQILQELELRNIKATFFCLGKIATDFPHVIKEIVNYGHEIGCHSDKHIWLTQMSRTELVKDCKDAINALEDVSGQKVVSYRAPAFSIGETNKWAIEVLAECGIEYDASIFPAQRDFGGFNTFKHDVPTIISTNEISIKEFPVCTSNILGKKFVFSGGGYFRFFPYAYIKQQMNKRNYTMCYFHIGDLIYHNTGFMSRTEYENYFSENGSLINRSKRYIKSNLGKKQAFSKLEHLLNDYKFTNIKTANSLINWAESPKITL